MKYVYARDNLVQIISVLKKNYESYLISEFRPLNIYGAQHAYITVICRNPGIIQNRLAEILGIDKANVTRSIADLVDKGFIERKKGEEDKKSWCLYPTQKSLDIYPQLVETFDKLIDSFYEGFTPDEKEQFLNYMNRISENVSKIRK